MRAHIICCHTPDTDSKNMTREQSSLTGDSLSLGIGAEGSANTYDRDRSVRRAVRACIDRASLADPLLDLLYIACYGLLPLVSILAIFL